MNFYPHRFVHNPYSFFVQESATAAIFDRASQLKRAGKPVISLCVGEPDFPIPTPIKEAIIQGVENNNTRYTPTAGLFELREAIAAKLLRDNGLVYSPEQIVVSNGAKQSIMQAMTVLLQPGDSVLIPAPYWPSYRDMAILNGAVPVEIPTQIKHQYKLTPDLLHGYLSSATKAKILLLCSPSNPTGSVYSRSELKALVSVISEFPQLFILSDEIYEYLLYEGEHVSIASFPEISARCIVINGFSKSFCMTGLRIGFAAAPLRISTELIKVQSHLTSCAGSLSQVAALAALRLQRESLSPMLQQFKERRDLVCNRLMELGNCVEFFTPQGAFYVFVDVSRVLRANPAGIQSDTELCLFLLENHCIALVPGSGFGCPGALRISYSISKMQLETAMDAFVKGIQTISSTP